LFYQFLPLLQKWKKLAKNGRNIKTLAQLFRQFLPHLENLKMWLKMDEKFML
jgi:hypothetical protein